MTKYIMMIEFEVKDEKYSKEMEDGDIDDLLEGSWLYNEEFPGYITKSKLTIKE